MASVLKLIGIKKFLINWVSVYEYINVTNWQGRLYKKL